MEGIMDIVCIDAILFGQLYSIQLADPKIFKVSEITCIYLTQPTRIGACVCVCACVSLYHWKHPFCDFNVKLVLTPDWSGT